MAQDSTEDGIDGELGLAAWAGYVQIFGLVISHRDIVRGTEGKKSGESQKTRGYGQPLRRQKEYEAKRPRAEGVSAPGLFA